MERNRNQEHISIRADASELRGVPAAELYKVTPEVSIRADASELRGVVDNIDELTDAQGFNSR